MWILISEWRFVLLIDSAQDNITFFAERLYQLSKSDKQSMAVAKLESVGLSEKY